MGSHVLKDSVVHNGIAWAINVDNSKNVKIDNNVIFNFRNWGVKVGASSSVTVDNNLIMHILERATFTPSGLIIDKWGGITLCKASTGTCSNLKARGNILAGIPWAGFTIPTVACDEENNDFANNVAHSIGNKYGGYGALITKDSNDPKQSTCTKATGMFSYKTKMGIAGGY